MHINKIMISIIICSRHFDISEELFKNIQDTIGYDYELIVIDNSANQYSIFSAYNEGVRRAKGDILCFMHEDILFHTNAWGQKVVDHFVNAKVGLIGVVGGHYMPKYPASWWSTECKSGKILQGQINDGIYSTEIFEWNRYKSESLDSVEAVVVDGLWFCIPRRLFDKIEFDEVTYTDFHCYDTDICFQILKLDYTVNVIFDILIEHKSYGNQNLMFYNERIKCFDKWNDSLPVVKGIVLSELEIQDRMLLVVEYNKELHRRLKVEEELIKARQSKTYRLGNFFLKPFKLLRK